MVVHGSTRGVRDDYGRRARAREDIRERRGRRMREVQDHALLDQPVDEPGAELRQPTGLCDPVSKRVATVPRQRRHPDAELPEDVRRPHFVAELLDALQGQDEADLLASLDWFEIVHRAHGDDAIRRLTCRSHERRRLPECLPESSLRLPVQGDEDRAHLEADAAGGKERKPGLREDIRLTEPMLAVGEFEQEIGMSVGEHRADHRS